ncbi:MAG TPA: hypothetical protein VND96_02530 [Candidatus Micrarchaeaceae archaeon]|nr:hypothetical protein [Candidatus Micrarchaeaceae archaeon]
MGIRLFIFVLAAAGLINRAGFSGTSWLWVMPVLMVLMMGVMFLVMPRQDRDACPEAAIRAGRLRDGRDALQAGWLCNPEHHL